MESVGVFLDEEWETLSRMFSTEADFMVQLYGQDKLDDGWSFGTSSAFMPTDEADHDMALPDQTSFYSSDNLNSNFQYFYQESSNSSDNNAIFFPTSNHESYPLSYSNDHISGSMDFCMMDNKNNNSEVPAFSDDIMEGILCLKEEMSCQLVDNADPVKELQLKRKFNVPELHTTNTSEIPKKKSRRNAQKCSKNAQIKKNQKLIVMNCDDEEKTNNVGPNGQSSSCYSSDNDSNASQEPNGAAASDSKGSASLNSKGKTRASRGSATDPQSLYARKRRERINERLRILQNLVPNGTKVDISTMLEEAVHYVKFLQLQIKLLSSDDMWMYAPIAYNGVDIGLYQKISASP